MTDRPVELLVSCPDDGSADKIAGAAVAEGLAASANISAVRSVYRWRGEVVGRVEAMIRFKTGAAQVEALSVLIRERHPYELPAITWIEVETDPRTAAWIVSGGESDG